MDFSHDCGGGCSSAVDVCGGSCCWVGLAAGVLVLRFSGSEGVDVSEGLMRDSPRRCWLLCGDGVDGCDLVIQFRTAGGGSGSSGLGTK